MFEVSDRVEISRTRVGLGRARASPGRWGPQSALSCPSDSTGGPATRRVGPLTAPKTPRWPSQEGHTAVPVGMARGWAVSAGHVGSHGCAEPEEETGEGEGRGGQQKPFKQNWT